jgi:acetylornithine deacetylase
MSHSAAAKTSAVLETVDSLRQEMTEAISEIVQMESINPKYPGQSYEDTVGGEGRVAKRMAEHYDAIGCTVDLFAIETSRENAVGVLKGRGGGRSLIFNGHVDVVPPGDSANWTSGSPFSGRVDGGRIWGRGATDMKGGIVAQTFAAKALRLAGVELNGDLILEAVVGEEVMDHECGTTATLRRGYSADAAIVAEPSAPPSPLAIVPITPGLWWFSVTVRGKPTHAAMRGETFRAGGAGSEVGVSAIDKGVYLFQAMRRLEDDWGQSKMHPLFRPGHFTIHPGVITGGPAGVLVPFVVSEYTTIEYCCWYHPDESAEDVRDEIESYIRRAADLDPWLQQNPPVFEWKLNWPAAIVPPDHPICETLQMAHTVAAKGTAYSDGPAICGFAAVEDTAFLNAGGVPAVSYGPGDLRVAHADDEYVLIDEVMVACKTFAMAAMTWCGVAD